MNNLASVAKMLGGKIAENSPTILSGLAVAGVITTSILAVRATPKALHLLEEYRNEQSDPRIGKLEIIRCTYRVYLPAAGVGLATIGCIIFGHAVSQRRIAAVAGAYGLAEAALREYQDKVVETIGKNKEERIRDEIAADRIKNNPPKPGEIIVTGKGEVLCYDCQTARYFKSSAEHIRQTINKLNTRLLNEDFVSLNEFYEALGVSLIPLGEIMGWKVDDGLIEIRFSSQLTDNDEPCLFIEYEVIPTPKYLR